LGWAPLQQLTRLGGTLARMPVHPLLGKMLLLSACFGCTDEILSGRSDQSPLHICAATGVPLRQGWPAAPLAVSRITPSREAFSPCARLTENAYP
jgi:HrpA-like RNA helicase